MTTIDNKGLNAVIPSIGGEELRIRVLSLVGKANRRGVWLMVTHNTELSTETASLGRNLFLLERPNTNTAKALGLWARKINVHARRIASYFEHGDTESIKRLVSSI